MKKLLMQSIVSAALVTTAAPFALAETPSGQPAADKMQKVTAKTEDASSRLPSKRMEARLESLKSALKISDAQEPQWNHFAETVRRHAAEADQRVAAYRARKESGEKGQQHTAIERMEQRQARLSAASKRMSETIAALKPLYAALNPEQQKVLDEKVMQRHGHHRQHKSHHGGNGHK